MKSSQPYTKYILLIIYIIIALWWSHWKLWKNDVLSPESLPQTYQDIFVQSWSYQANTLTGYQALTGIILKWPVWSSGRSQRLRLLGSNKQFIRGWIYDMTDPTTTSWMRKNSTPISLIVENNKYQQFDDSFWKLQTLFSGSNIQIFPDKDLRVNNTHAKAFAGEHRRVIQTANLNKSSWFSNREHFFFWTDPRIKQNLLDLFALDMKTITTKQKNTADYKSLTASFVPSLVVCPLDCRVKIEQFLNWATKSIRISTQYITDDRILSILRKKSSLDLRILTNDMETNNDLVLYFWKKAIRFEQWKIYNHDKMIIVDNARMLIGSANLSQNSLDHNREIGIITTDMKLIKDQISIFQ